MAQLKLKQISVSAMQQARQQQLHAVGQNQPGSTKKPRTIVPPPQSVRIMQRYIGGESIRQIARAERRDRATVTRIVCSDEMQTYVHQMRERFYGLGFDALAAVEHTLQVQKDGRLAYQLLTDIGVVPSREERYAIATQSMSMEKWALTPFEVAMAEDEDGRINRVAYGGACAMEMSAEYFDISLPTPEEVRRSRMVAKVADEIAGGRFHQICLTDGTEEKRIRRLAEQKVKHEEARRALPPRHGQRAHPHKKQTAM